MSQLSISDHALIRWIERTGMADLEPVRDALRASLARATGAAGKLGSGEYLILADGLVYVVRNNVLITVIEDDGRHSRIRAMQHRQEHRPDA
ncbi:MAG: hypothetical protein U9R07_11795 [Pseudomonadota bacterium]|nr:hypothetical protein [Pseudomonadota bacterium]